MSILTIALTALTGGTAGALDKIDGNTGGEGGGALLDDDAAVVVLSTGVYHYHLNATSGATENSPYVIAPDTNPGTKRWILVIPMGPFSHVKAENTAGQTTILNNTSTKINYAVEIRDSLSEYNTSTSTFTAIYSGIYKIRASAFYSVGFSAGDRTWLAVYINGTINQYIGYDRFQASTSLGLLIQGEDSFELSAADAVTIYMNQNSGSSATIPAGADFSFFTIDRIA